MTDRGLVLTGRVMAAIGITATLAGWAWSLAGGIGSVLFDEWAVFNGALAIGVGLIAWTVLPTQPRNGAVWPSAIVSVSSGLFVLVFAWVLQMGIDLGMDIDELYGLAPADLETWRAVVIMFASVLFLPFILLLTVGLVLFPDGRAPSPRWRWTVWAAYGSVIAQVVALLWIYRPGGTTIYGSAQSNADFFTQLGPVVAIANMVSILLIPVCVAGLVVRFRRSVGVERQQFRLVVWGAALAGALIVLAVVGDLTGGLDPRWPSLLMVVVLVGAYGVAIAKYRLYDVDVVISRTFVYGLLAVFIGAVYVSIVVGLGFVVGAGEGASFGLGIVATVVIAIAFQPLRRRLERLANRIVYGRRSTPYEVLSAFSQSVAAVDPSVLEDVAKSLADGTTAVAVSIWVERGDDFHRIASWPESGVSVDGVPEGDYLENVVHDGERLGVVSLTLPPGQPIPPNDVELVEQVAGGLGLALRNLQLTDDLQARVDQLRESRRRVVAVQDQTRQMLERDLHDGAQQRLVALKIKVGLGSTMAERRGFNDVKDILDTVKEETDLTIESLRNLARGIYPPLLEAEGLGAALTAQLRRAPLPVTVQSAGMGRHPRELESTVYFCVLEAVQNAIKHSRAKSVLVALNDDHSQLTFEVRDDGIGFDPDAATDGHGLQNMEDRLDAVNGTLEIDTTRDHGTRVVGRIAVTDLVVPA